MIVALLLQAALPAAPTITLAEARSMSPAALAGRLLPGEKHGPIVDAIVNGRGLRPPSASVNRVWLVEQMVPFDATTCRSHVFQIEMGHSDPSAKLWSQSLPTHPVKIEQYDRLWVPPNGAATVPACAAAPAQASGFDDGGLGLAQAATLVQQARAAFKTRRRLKIRCRGKHDLCGTNPRRTLAGIDWSLLGSVEQVDPKGEPYSLGDPKPEDAAWGPRHVQFTFPYAAGGATWEITVDRAPEIKSVRMRASTVIYH
jgi:hypothetical protein